MASLTNLSAIRLNQELFGTSHTFPCSSLFKLQSSRRHHLRMDHQETGDLDELIKHWRFWTIKKWSQMPGAGTLLFRLVLSICCLCSISLTNCGLLECPLGLHQKPPVFPFPKTTAPASIQNRYQTLPSPSSLSLFFPPYPFPKCFTNHHLGIH